jgi:triacylglycerol lipase
MNGPFASFNPNTTRWAAPNALALAYAARLAYSDSAAIQQQLAQWGFDPARFVFLQSPNVRPLLDTQGYMVANDEAIIIAFRGTQPDKVQDWLTDLDAILRPFVVGRVHQGFYDGLNEVWPDLLASLDQLQDKAQSVWITGHSLGAALACMATARLVIELRLPVNGLYTFGQPRTGDLEFGHAFDTEFFDKTFRFVNDCDVVTRVPPRALFFSHVGRAMFFDKGGVLHDDDHFWNKFLTEVQVGIDGFEHPPAIITEHFMDLYVANVQNNQNFVVT